jgi:hypothetical protein
VLIAISTVSFADMLKQPSVPSPALTDYVDKLKTQYPTAKFLSFALWGVSDYYAESQNASNREYTARAQNDQTKIQKAYEPPETKNLFFSNARRPYYVLPWYLESRTRLLSFRKVVLSKALSGCRSIASVAFENLKPSVNSATTLSS